MPRYRTEAIRGPSFYTSRPIQPRPEDAARWQQWCANIETYIEAVRKEADAEQCPVCRCTTHPRTRIRGLWVAV